MCARNTTEVRFIGISLAHYRHDGRNTDLLRGDEELIFNEDGTFSQLYIAPGGATQTHYGRWTYDEKAGRVHFSSLRSWEDRDLLGFPTQPLPTGYDLPVSTYGNFVHVELNLDLGTSFKKAAD